MRTIGICAREADLIRRDGLVDLERCAFEFCGDGEADGRALGVVCVGG
jgi:hypothetical protein